MDRVVSQMLAEVDGLQSQGIASAVNSQDVFLIGATNRPGPYCLLQNPCVHAVALSPDSKGPVVQWQIQVAWLILVPMLVHTDLH